MCCQTGMYLVYQKINLVGIFRRHCHFDMAKIAVIVYVVCRVWEEGMPTLCVRRPMSI